MQEMRHPNEYAGKRARLKRWHKLVLALSCAVVFITTYALILPAVTMTHEETFCAAEEHAHGEGCFAPSLSCTQEHEHTDDCYTQVLVCELPEHTHSLACYADPQADVESPEVWQRMAAQLSPSENPGENIVTAAQSQLGYAESTRNYSVDENGLVSGYTRYGAWLGQPYGEWNAAFAAFCLHFAGVQDAAFAGEADCAAWTQRLQSAGYWQAEPQIGAPVFFDTDGDGLADRVGIVTQTGGEGADAYIRTVEGDISGTVAERRYALSDGQLLGFGCLPQPEEAPEAEQALTYAGEDHEIRLSWEDPAALPPGTELSVREIDPESEEYDLYYHETLDTLLAEGQLEDASQLPFARFFDLTLLHDGQEVEPAAPVTVHIQYDEALPEDMGEPQLVRLAQDEADLVTQALSDFPYESSAVVGLYATKIAPDGPSGSGAATATVIWSWADGTEGRENEEITVLLYKDGTETGLRAALNAENGWRCTFMGLQKDANYTIQYTTRTGYYYTERCDVTPGEAIWTRADALTSGKTYVLVYGNGQAVQNVSGNTLSAGSVTVSGDALAGVTEAMQWDYSGGMLKNGSTGQYLQLYRSNRNYTWRCYTSGSTVSYQNGRISATGGNAVYYLQNSGASTTSQGSATQYTPYEKSYGAADIVFTVVAEQQKEGEPSVPVTGSGVPRFEHNKTIDYLGDGETNPDTTLAGKDYYRLYLDMVGKSEPIDLLVVVDGSGSMTSNSDVTYGGVTMRRDRAVTNFLNGTDTDEGFIEYFLSLNENNRISVVQFYGNASYTIQDNNGYTNLTGSNYPGYTADSGELLGWTSTVQHVDCTGKDNNGTNYEAGLKAATEQFKKVSGHRKLMIFLSDGVPTYFIIDQSDTEIDYDNDTLRTNLTAANVGKRFGTGLDKNDNGANYTNCKAPSLQAFTEFQLANPDVTVFSIGFAKGFNDTTNKAEILEEMAERTGGTYYVVTESMDNLKIELESIFYPKAVTITDELSKYVRFYAEQPDVKVTMKDLTTGEETVLWQNGENFGRTDAKGFEIFREVLYEALDEAEAPQDSTGIVKAIFGAEHCMTPTTRYTLSFNVKVTQTAYDEYRESGYSAVTGDAETDYGTNVTSSMQPGFHSNTTAYTSYIVNGAYHRDTYDHPVVQVDVPEPGGYELPETGGAGTAWAWLLGSALILTAGILLAVRRKRLQ